MNDFKEKFKYLIETIEIPTNADQVMVTEGWKQIYELLLPHIPENFFDIEKLRGRNLNCVSKGKG